MKTIRFIGLFLVTVTVIASPQSSAQQPMAEEFLADPQKRQEIMKTICKDHEMMNEMMEQMMQNEHAMQMMMGMMKKDTVTTKMMMEDMMHMMESDFVMCKMMGDMMMSNQHMMNMMHGMKGEKRGMMRGRMMMCPMHSGMKISDDIEGEMEHHHNH